MSEIRPEDPIWNLLPDLRARRVLELGWEQGRSLAIAKAGAHLVVVDPSDRELVSARRLAEQEGLTVELRRADFADLAFLRADSVDVALSSSLPNLLEDLRRVFRQVNRVLRPGGTLVVALEHPFGAMVEEGSDGPMLRGSYFELGDDNERPQTIEEVFTALVRSGFQAEVLRELPPVVSKGLPTPRFPTRLVFRAKKENA